MHTAASGTERFCAGASGTTQRTTAIAAIARAPVSAKMPRTPIERSRKGAATNDTANTAPMVEPMIAIALVRWPSRVKSAVMARVTAEMAPAPCTMRPAIIAHGLSPEAHKKLPAAKMASPACRSGLRP